MKTIVSRLCVFLCLFISACHTDKGPVQDQPPLFQLQPASQTGIGFINKVEDSRTFNIFNYRNFYNGGGVAIGDINNDGKPDIFFTSNQGRNRLYLNKGSWNFEDISDKAGIGGIHKWHTGVTMADIDGDGWLDIYVSNSGEIDGSNRENELYINNHDGTFTEKAHEYGLDDKGIGTQAAFFDYDHDGDLDCFVLNNSFRPIESFGYDRRIRHIRSVSGGHRLYRNDNGHFTDVSESAGIYGSEIGFGLGVTVGDLNNDGWPDLYVSNDFFEKDYCYINQRNGHFVETTENSFGHLSLASMGSDMADINNDGYLDIFTTDMLPEEDQRLKTTTKFENYNVLNAKLNNDFHHQFASNCLQLNNGDGTFSEIACLAGVEATDWSWGALSFDFDNDGWKDLFVSNGISKDLTNQDFLDYFSDDETKAQVIKGGFNYKEFLDKMVSTPIPNYAFVNQHDGRFINKSAQLGLGAPSFSNGAAYGDLDGDGDIDLVVSNANAVASVFRNMSSETLHTRYISIALKGQSPNTGGIGARVTIYTKGQQQILEQVPTRGFESSVEPVLHFGLGQTKTIDSLIVLWPNMRQQTIQNPHTDTTLTLNQQDAKEPASINNKPGATAKTYWRNATASDIKGHILHHENNFIDFDKENLIPKMLSEEGPKLAVGDLDGDGLEDFIVGSAAHDTARVFFQQPGGHFIEKPQSVFIQDVDYENIGLTLFDADNDGDLDLVAASGGNQEQPGSVDLLTRLYLNDGKGNFSKSVDGWPLIGLNASCVRAQDIDGDGKIDLFIGGRSISGSYGMSPGSILLHNEGNAKFTDITAKTAPDLQTEGMVTDARWADIDGDGRNELILVGDWMPVTIYKLDNGKLKRSSQIPHSEGWWNCLQTADLNEDGRPDLIAGNNGLNSKIRADQQHPARLFIEDFNNNGQMKCIAAYYKTDGKSYPINLRGDLVSQIPTLKKKFLRYDSYAGKTLEEVLTPEQIQQARQLRVEQTQTCVFYNKDGRSFDMQPLPLRAQFAPVFGITATDIDGDGITDLFLGGNFYGLKPEIGRYDASYGVTLLGTKQHTFNYCPPNKSGLFIKGEVRDVQPIKTGTGISLIMTRNNDSLQLFQPWR